MKQIEKFWNSLDGVMLARKRELLLGGLLCLTTGLTLGMLLSPKKTVIIGDGNWLGDDLGEAYDYDEEEE